MDAATTEPQGDDDERTPEDDGDGRQPGTGGSMSTPLEDVQQDDDADSAATIPPDGNGTAISPSR